MGATLQPLSVRRLVSRTQAPQGGRLGAGERRGMAGWHRGSAEGVILLGGRGTGGGVASWQGGLRGALRGGCRHFPGGGSSVGTDEMTDSLF